MSGGGLFDFMWIGVFFLVQLLHTLWTISDTVSLVDSECSAETSLWYTLSIAGKICSAASEVYMQLQCQLASKGWALSCWQHWVGLCDDSKTWQNHHNIKNQTNL